MRVRVKSTVNARPSRESASAFAFAFLFLLLITSKGSENAVSSEDKLKDTTTYSCFDFCPFSTSRAAIVLF